MYLVSLDQNISFGLFAIFGLKTGSCVCKVIYFRSGVKLSINTYMITLIIDDVSIIV